MPANLNASTKYITQGAVALPTAALSIAIKFKPSWAPSDGTAHILFSIYAAANLFDINKYIDNKLYAGWLTSGIDYRAIANAGSTGIVQNAWNVIVVTCNDTSNVTNAWMNGTKVATNSSLITHTTSNTRHVGYETVLGSDTVASEVDYFAIWSTDISDSEIALLTPSGDGSSVSPQQVRSASIETFHRYSPAYVSGSTVTAIVGANGTLVGSPTITDGPPLLGANPRISRGRTGRYR